MIVGPTTVEDLIRAQAYGLGFDLVGITTLGPVESAAAFDEWLAAGYSGGMDYLVRDTPAETTTTM